MKPIIEWIEPPFWKELEKWLSELKHNQKTYDGNTEK